MSRVAPVPAAPSVPVTDSGSVTEAGEAPEARRSTLSRVAKWFGLGQANPLARRFLLASMAVLLAGGVIIGWWVGDQLERGIIDRTASITGLYVQSFLAPEIETLGQNEWLSDAEKTHLDALLTDTAFGERVVALKLWRPDGVIVYSPERTLIGEQFELSDGLRMALTGTVVAEMSELDADENVTEQARGFDRLLEMYLPVRERGGDQIVAVAEFYHLPAEIEQQVASARLQSWIVVAGAVTLAFLLLYGMVRQGGETIDRQRLALEGQVDELSQLLSQNEQLRQRVRVAAERTTTLSERALRRISSDLHDGPAQLMALAMLRLDQLRSKEAATDPATEAEIAQLQQTLNEALADMRGIAAGLRLPELGTLSPADIARRAVDDHSRRTGVAVQLDVSADTAETSLSTKIALFRALQELLSNATRHGAGRDVAVGLVADDERVELTVSDRGPGFADARVGEEGRLGLAGLREQAELLGGAFSVGAREDGGARVTVMWPS